MRLVCISDMHGYKIPIPDGDVLICAGDYLRTESLLELEAFNLWLGTLPHRHKIVIAGNHDFVFEKHLEVARAALTSAIYLQDSEVVIDGVRFYGSPWQPEFFSWAFNLPRGQKIADKWAMIPNNTDVLITHGPPNGILDKVQRGHVGCEELLKVVQAVKPSLHIFGHIHEGYGQVEIGETLFVNASICTDRYKPTNQPICVDI